MKATRTERHIVSKNNRCWALIDNYCFRSKNLYNYANYLIRQEFINNGKWIRYRSLFDECKDSEPYKDIGSNVGQQTLKILDKSWTSFFASIKDWNRHKEKYRGRPKLPRYKEKDGRYILGIDNIKFYIKAGFVYFSWKPLKSLNETFATKIPADTKLLQCRFIPRGSNYIMEIVYEIELPELAQSTERIASIDTGLVNFATITNNIGLQPIVIKGGALKSINQYYNKKKAAIQSELQLKNGKHWSNRLDTLTQKRNNKIDSLMHLYSKKILDWCASNRIDTLVVGVNEGWKNNVNMGKRNNQNFVQIPTAKFISMLRYKCENYGVRFVCNEESYTSKASFLDLDSIPTYKECVDFGFSGKRVKRGLYKSSGGKGINADVNGSYNIMRKAFPNAFSNGIEGAGCHPATMKIA